MTDYDDDDYEDDLDLSTLPDDELVEQIVTASWEAIRL